MLNFILAGLIAALCLFFPVTDNAGAASSISGQNASTPPKGEKALSPEEEDLGRSPGQIVDILEAKSSNWQEPSRHSEERYVLAIRQWLDNMQPRQREKARSILREAHPDMHALRTAIREKKEELANMSFNRHTSPEALPRLGQELQSLRKSLRTKLEVISQRLRKEAGVSMGPLEGDSFWLAPIDMEGAKPKAYKKIPLNGANSESARISAISMN